ncbi:hypothetical protein [Sorangium sp. So ce1389]|uniref:hypothetical protein n=1 Tax=Sorangium sp. So ce1389 TaxID=3133336 RepID=UPI003F605145
MRNLILFVLVPLFSACNRPSSPSGFEGTWNYDLPDRASGTNLAHVSCPAQGGAPAVELDIPQIGTLVLARDGDRTLAGRTDQGCSWTFHDADDEHASFASAEATCDNPVIGSSYTITSWTLARDGDGAAEVVDAISHRPGGPDCDFVLAAGKRTWVDPDADDDPAAAFVGSWAYAPPDPLTRTNVATVACADAEGNPLPPSYEPQLGSIAIERTGPHTAAATDGDGCTWTFAVHGNTALLDPPTQSCGPLTLHHWALAGDGVHAFEVRSGERDGCRVLLTIGERARQ